ncbi:unnamed protein product, partial [Discosporangium mesarthrocarpum]
MDYATAEDTSTFQKGMQEKQHNILMLERRVLEKREKARTVLATTRRKVQEKRALLSRHKMTGWQAGFGCTIGPDAGNRPSDRQFPVRNYSLMDNQVWSSDQVRNWFDAYATPEEGDKLDPVTTGYLTRARKSDSLPPLLQTPQMPKWALKEDKTQAMAAARRKFESDIDKKKWPKDHHFLDFEGNLNVAQVRNEKILQRFEVPNGWGWGHNHVA